jgi:hypothetical protein
LWSQNSNTETVETDGSLRKGAWRAKHIFRRSHTMKNTTVLTLSFFNNRDFWLIALLKKGYFEATRTFDCTC